MRFMVELMWNGLPEIGNWWKQAWHHKIRDDVAEHVYSLQLFGYLGFSCGRMAKIEGNDNCNSKCFVQVCVSIFP